MCGALLCLLSAACFGTLGVFGKLATDAGANIPSLLLVRFGLAAVAFWLLLRATGGWAGLRRLPRRVVLIGLGLGAAGYSLQSTFFFAAIDRLDVSLVSLLLYTYPAFVTVAALALGRAEPSLRIGVALVVASAGLALVLGERLAPAQLAGGALVLGAVVMLQLPARRRRRAAASRVAPALAEARTSGI